MIDSLAIGLPGGFVLNKGVKRMAVVGDLLGAIGPCNSSQEFLNNARSRNWRT